MPFDSYDPRLKEDWHFELGRKRFSSLSHGFYLLQGEGVLWDPAVSLLKEAAGKTSSLCFATVVPWKIGRKKGLVNAFKETFPDNYEVEGTMIGYFEDPALFQNVFNLQREVGGWPGGLWTLGGALARFTPPAERKWLLGAYEQWDYVHILDQAEKITFMLSLGEMEQSILATRIFDGFDDWRQRIQKTVIDQ